MAWEDGSPYVEELADGAYAYVQPVGGWMVNNCGFVVDGAGASVLIDSTSTERRQRAFLAEVAKVATGDPLAAINTHHHPDHTYGNCLLPSTTPVIAHRGVREKVLRAGLAATKELPADYGAISVRPPDIEFVGTIALPMSDRTVEVISVGPAHTPNDVVVWLPEQRVLFAGDLVFAGGHPIFVEGSLPGYRDVLQWIRGLGAEVILPGHGPAQRGAQVGAMLDTLGEYLNFVERLALDSYAAGLSPLEAALGATDTPYTSWPEGERLVCNLHRAYEELTDYEPPKQLIIPNLWDDMTAVAGGPIHTEA